MTMNVRIGSSQVGAGLPCYFIAEVGSNFDGDLERAKQLATLAKEAGAQAAKFQSFLPEKIIKAEGFAAPEGFQAKWGRSVWSVYSDASFPREWHAELNDHCASIGIDFFSSPYDEDAVDLLDDLDVPAHKVGSGEINNLAFLRRVAQSGRPVILGTGASTLAEVSDAVAALRVGGCESLVLLQCITNYPSTIEGAEIRAMVQMGETFSVPYGYSDHTPGHLVAVASVALGGCMIEKHFTDDTSRTGPDHPFAMDAQAFRAMVDAVRSLEQALGSGHKSVTAEETKTRVVQRRGLWLISDKVKGEVLTEDDVEVLRPAHGLPPGALGEVLGVPLARDVAANTPIDWGLFRA